MEIYILYHCPCVDGAFSLLVLCLFFKYFLIKNNSNFTTLFELLLAEKKFDCSDEKQTRAEDKETSIMEEEKKENTNNNKEIKDEDVKENVMMDEEFNLSPESISKQIKYFAIKPSPNGNLFSDFLKYVKNGNGSEKIIISLDYYCESEVNIRTLSLYAKRVIIIDHHITLTFYNLLNIPNLEVFFDLKKSGATLTLDYFSKLMGEQLIPKSILQKLNKFLSYVQDQDLHTGLFKETEAFISGLFKFKYDMNVFKNDILFNQIFKFSPETYIKFGNSLVEEKNILVNEYFKSRKILKVKLDNGKEITCFACKISDNAVINDLGEKLAEEGVKNNFNNLGVVYRNDKNPNLYKISVRGSIKHEDGSCLELTNYWGGGGHKYAAGCFLNKKKLHKYFS